MNDLIFEVKFNTAEELLTSLTPWSDFYTEHNLYKYIFRGQSNAEYSLTPCSLRDEANGQMDKEISIYIDHASDLKNNAFLIALREFQLIRDFYKQSDIRGLYVPNSEILRTSLYKKTDISTMTFWADQDVWLPEDMLEAAALAQHYGVSTRLLDWSYDPMVAAFFASNPNLTGNTTGFKKDGNLSIWALNTDIVNFFDTAKEGIELHDPENDFESFPLKLITPTYHGNPNLAAQQGVFTHWAMPLIGISSLNEYGAVGLEKRLEVLVKEYLQRHNISKPLNSYIFLKLVLSNIDSEKLAKHLRSFGYGPARIFPGYDGVKMEMSERQHFTRTKC